MRETVPPNNDENTMNIIAAAILARIVAHLDFPIIDGNTITVGDRVINLDSYVWYGKEAVMATFINNGETVHNQSSHILLGRPSNTLVHSSIAFLNKADSKARYTLSKPFNINA